MIISSKELEKLCLLIYPYLFDYQEIDLNQIMIDIDDVFTIEAKLNYYNVTTVIKAKVKVVLNDNIVVVIDGIIKYGFINLDCQKVIKELLKEYSDIFVGDKIVISNNYFNSLKLKKGYVMIELK